MPENERQERNHQGEGTKQGEDTSKGMQGGVCVAVQGAQELIKP